MLWESGARHLHDVAGPAKLMVDDHRLAACGVCLQEDATLGAALTSAVPTVQAIGETGY